LDKDIGKAIEKRKRIQEMHEGLPQINCGACGAPTCLSFAEDVVLGRAALEDCVVLTAKQTRSAAHAPSGLTRDPQVLTL
jgi:ArsR family metal-binding transcriptional regulator